MLKGLRGGGAGAAAGQEQDLCYDDMKVTIRNYCLGFLGLAVAARSSLTSLRHPPATPPLHLRQFPTRTLPARAPTCPAVHPAV